MDLQLQRLHPKAITPKYNHPGDAGMNLFTYEERTLAPGERYAFSTGWAMAFPPEYVARVLDRSGLSLKTGLHCLGGVIDSNYRGEWKIIMANLGDQPYTVQAGDKIAQVVFLPIEIASPTIVDVLNESARGTGGFGSTGNR
ncbi:dUTP diphosphatase [Candidatus Berkelbacteria bacterium]|nr:dUTP diphosphatase [Candidatus Berkelbacteria bacterium]